MLLTIPFVVMLYIPLTLGNPFPHHSGMVSNSGSDPTYSSFRSLNNPLPITSPKTYFPTNLENEGKRWRKWAVKFGRNLDFSLSLTQGDPGLINDIKYFPEFIDSFPFHLELSNNVNVTVTKFIGSGSEGSVYEGYFTSDKSKERIILKAFKHGHYLRPHQSFLNEAAALEKLSRLLVSDVHNKIVVQKKINGELLGDVLAKCFKIGGHNRYKALSKVISSQEPLSVKISDLFKEIEDTFKNKLAEEKYHRLLRKYWYLLDKFHTEFGMIHNDIHPNNVIVNSDEELVLIDFGQTVPISDDPITAQAQKDFDRLLAESNI